MTPKQIEAQNAINEWKQTSEYKSDQNRWQDYPLYRPLEEQKYLCLCKSVSKDGKYESFYLEIIDWCLHYYADASLGKDPLYGFWRDLIPVIKYQAIALPDGISLGTFEVK